MRAVFHKELGFWDGDPATILPLLPEDHAKRHVDLIGREKILAEGRNAFDAGDYRWAVQLLHHLVFADSDDEEAKNLQADAYEQLGYQQEVPQYRSIFLATAMELRNGVTGAGQVNTDSTDTILSMPIDLLFDYAGVHLVAEKANDVDISINFSFADTKQDWNMWVRRAVLNARSGRAPDAQLTVTGPKPLLAGILLQPGKASAILESGKVTHDGDVSTLSRFADIMDVFDPNFNIATP